MQGEWPANVSGIDSFYTRRRVREVGSDSAIPIKSMERRIESLKEVSDHRLNIQLICFPRDLRFALFFPGSVYAAFCCHRSIWCSGIIYRYDI